jgi:hypothetical protein
LNERTVNSVYELASKDWKMNETEELINSEDWMIIKLEEWLK